MARRYAQVRVSLWNDPDFRVLPQDLQHAWLMFTSHPRLNLCGVLDYLPGRLALSTYGYTGHDIERVTAELENRGLVVVDRESSELAVAWFIRQDDILRQPNVSKGMAADYGEIVSDRIRLILDRELIAMYADDPTLKGWEAVGSTNPGLLRAIQEGVP